MKNRIKEAIKNAGYASQKEFITKHGFKQSTFSGYVSGSHDPKYDVLAKIAQLTGTTVDFLLYNDTSPSAPEGAEETVSKDNAEQFGSALLPALIDLGFIDAGEDLSGCDLAFLTSVVHMLCAYFRSTHQNR